MIECTNISATLTSLTWYLGQNIMNTYFL